MRYVHQENCRCGSLKTPLEANHDWWVNAPEYGNCFWTYLRYNERPHSLSEISKITKMSISVITSLEKKALATIRDRSKDLDPKDQ